MNNLSADENRPLSGNQNAEREPSSWSPLNRVQRRVLGVLVEKSKTTPDGYPMSLNAIKVGCNQKSNRSPQMDLEEHQVEDALYQLRSLGAVAEVHSGGRVPKYKHLAYDWLGVDKAELGVMAELMLRGEQTVGDLRARSSRMERTITGLEELVPVLATLKSKRLLVELTPAGRGQIVTHHLYLPEELDRLRSQFVPEVAAAGETGADESGSAGASSLRRELPGDEGGSVGVPSSQSAVARESVSSRQSVSVGSDPHAWQARMDALEAQHRALFANFEELKRRFVELQQLVES